MYWKNGYLTKVFRNAKNIRHINIVVAYLSDFGLDLLRDCVERNDLSIDKVNVFLSVEFSKDNPAELLESLSKIATVKILTKRDLHAKVYAFYNEHKVEIYSGSANLTYNGCESNLEYIHKETVSINDVETTKKKIEWFLDVCNFNSILVNDKIIEAYESRSANLKEIVHLENGLKTSLYSIFERENIFYESTYDLSERFFKYLDYETLFPINAEQKTESLNKRRISIKKKLLEINNILNPKLRKLDLHNHWSEKHIISSDNPNVFNHNRVGWMGVRYGKTEQEVKFIESTYSNRNYKRDNFSGYQKHACMQVSLVQDSLLIGLFHAVANEAVDRLDIEKLSRISTSIIYEIEKIQGEGFAWQILDKKGTNLVKEFSIDDENPEEFIDFYKEYDREGCESMLVYRVRPDDVRMVDQYSIAQLAEDKISKLNQLYNIITFRPFSKSSFE